MKEIDYIPLQCTEQQEGEEKIPPTFSGSIKVRLPSFKERCEMYKIIGLKAGGNGVDMEDLNKDPFDLALKMGTLAEQFVKEVSLKKLSDGTEYKSFEDLSYDQECDKLIVDLGSQMLRGFGPSAKQKPL